MLVVCKELVNPSYMNRFYNNYCLSENCELCRSQTHNLSELEVVLLCVAGRMETRMGRLWNSRETTVPQGCCLTAPWAQGSWSPRYLHSRTWTRTNKVKTRGRLIKTPDVMAQMEALYIYFGQLLPHKMSFLTEN